MPLYLSSPPPFPPYTHLIPPSLLVRLRVHDRVLGDGRRLVAKAFGKGKVGVILRLALGRWRSSSAGITDTGAAHQGPRIVWRMIRAAMRVAKVAPAALVAHLSRRPHPARHDARPRPIVA